MNNPVLSTSITLLPSLLMKSVWWSLWSFPKATLPLKIQYAINICSSAAAFVVLRAAMVGGEISAFNQQS